MVTEGLFGTSRQGSVGKFVSDDEGLQAIPELDWLS
jgi:hypothetical protein